MTDAAGIALGIKSMQLDGDVRVVALGFEIARERLPIGAAEFADVIGQPRAQIGGFADVQVAGGISK